MRKHAMQITSQETNETQSRIIITVNGCELDIITNNDGFIITYIKNETLMTECGMDWDEDHINA